MKLDRDVFMAQVTGKKIRNNAWSKPRSTTDKKLAYVVPKIIDAGDNDYFFADAYDAFDRLITVHRHCGSIGLFGEEENDWNWYEEPINFSEGLVSNETREEKL